MKKLLFILGVYFASAIIVAQSPEEEAETWETIFPPKFIVVSVKDTVIFDEKTQEIILKNKSQTDTLIVSGIGAKEGDVFTPYNPE